MLKWKLEPAELFERRLKKYSKNHGAETKAMLANLVKLRTLLETGVAPLQGNEPLASFIQSPLVPLRLTRKVHQENGVSLGCTSISIHARKRCIYSRLVTRIRNILITSIAQK
jgi:hypothetical protein